MAAIRQNIGRVGLRLRGTWIDNPQEPFMKMDVVEKDGTSYASKVDNNTTTPPSPSWQVQSQRGAVGQGVPNGGSTGQVLCKDSNADYDTKWVNPVEQIQSDWNQSDNTQKDFIKNKPSIPSKLSDLDDDAAHRVVTDTEKTTWNNKSDFSGSYNDLTNKPTIPTVPTNVSAFNNDAGYITKTVNDLVNYYLKSDTYTKTEVQQLIATIKQFTYQVVSTLPTASVDTMNIIYLVPSANQQTQNVKDEYITIDNGAGATTRYTWEQIGSTAIDLSGYYTSQQTDAAITAALNTALADYTTTAALTLLLAAKQDVISDLATIRSGASAGATAYQKPQSGIPSTDMSSAVQTSLGKADTALQTQVQANWNETDSGAASYIQNKPDLSGYEGKVNIVAPVNATDATDPITSLSCDVGKYYRVDVAVDTLAVTLPAVEDITHVNSITIMLTAGTTPAITFTAQAIGGVTPDVYTKSDFEIEAGKTYEISALFNGSAWVLTSVEIDVTSNP